MKTLLSFLFLGFFLTTGYSQTQQTSNWTEADKKQYKSECLRGIEMSNPNLTSQQKNNYCDCVLKKIIKAFPNKHSQQDMEIMMKIARECSKQYL